MIKNFTKRASFCTIAPTAYLDQYARALQSSYHLLLAHLMDPTSSLYDEKYTEFYKTTKLPNETYILDNGAFELGKSYAPDRLVEIGQQVGADIIVLPDYPGWHWTYTKQAADQYIPEFKSAGFKTFFVPQSSAGDWDGWMEGFEWALFNPDIDVIGMSIIAHPHALPHIPKCYARVVAGDRIRTWLLADQARAQAFNAKHIHWLGFLSPGLELAPLSKMRLIDTIDSSGPVWYGHCGVEYNKRGESWSPIDKRYIPEVDFSAKYNHHASELIDANLRLVHATLNAM